MKRFFIALLIVAFACLPGYGQETVPPPTKEVKQSVEGWIGLYTKYRIKPKWYYYGEYHYRRRDNFTRMANVYLRYGITHIPNKNLEFTLGIVTPFYWAKEHQLDDPNVDVVVPQYRLWQQMVSVMSFDKVKLYHQIRTEQRWARKNVIGSSFNLTHRFRYKLSTYIPLNRDHLMPGALFFSGYEEIFIQSGKTVLFDHFEDNRLFLGLGYILNDQIQIQVGYMWTYRHYGEPHKYESRHIPRISFYHNLDFHEMGINKGKKFRSNKILNNEF